MSNSDSTENIDALSTLGIYYSVQLLNSKAVHPSPLNEYRRPDDLISTILEIEEDEARESSVSNLRNLLEDKQAYLRNRMNGDSNLRRNIQVISLELGLEPVESEIFCLAILMKYDGTLAEVASNIGIRSREQLTRILSSVMPYPTSTIRKAIAYNSRLYTAALLTAERSFGRQDLQDAICVNSAFQEIMIHSELSLNNMFEQFARKAPSPQIELLDYPHLSNEIGFMHDLLKGAAKQNASGVNILLYGPPGTGKTQLARALAHSTNLSALETTDIGEDGDPLDAEGRLNCYATTQRLMAARGAYVIIFDEVEEILNSDDRSQLNPFGTSNYAPSNKKSWKNRLLEENEIPTIWIANQIHRFDPALLRRFTYSLLLDNPPQSTRKKLVTNSFKGLKLGQKTLNNLIESEHLTPADINRTISAISLAGLEKGKEEDRILLALGGRHQGVKVKPEKRNSFVTLPYRTEWINTTPDIRQVKDLLSRRGEGRLCFSGPPGTGKTAFAKQVARELDKPLLMKRASDLISPYIGETEVRMMKAFEEAYSSGSILFIDEADSFLLDRSTATRSWEFSQVNELLTQIDNHAGYLILATNYKEKLDRALSRRIDLKVEFDRMNEDSSIEAIYLAGKELGIKKRDITKSINSYAFDVQRFTFGEIAAALRQAQLLADKPDAQLLMESLVRECQESADFKKQPIGFIT